MEWHRASRPALEKGERHGYRRIGFVTDLGDPNEGM